jgi:uncharacterized membrane protein YbaN (DUF454 family)
MNAPRRSSPKRFIYIGLGFVFLAFSYVGIILPGVPAIPFILLTAFFFANSSPSLQSWLLRQRIIGALIRKTEGKKGKIGYALLVISQLWVSIIVADILFIHAWSVRIFIGIVGVAGSVFIYFLMTKR